ncbi:MAG: hypothetical protein M5U34_20240 [Chloroflexi bacterium]|nr:hypothetical protein [Chloroflexota bacterium]
MAYELQAREINDMGVLLYEVSQLYTNRLRETEFQILCPLKQDLPAVIGKPQ